MYGCRGERIIALVGAVSTKRPAYITASESAISTEFKIGDRVSFQPDGHHNVVGMLARYNRKTVTVITNDGQRWNVSPTLLRRPDDGRDVEDAAANVVSLRRK